MARNYFFLALYEGYSSFDGKIQKPLFSFCPDAVVYFGLRTKSTNNFFTESVSLGSLTSGKYNLWVLVLLLLHLHWIFFGRIMSDPRYCGDIPMFAGSHVPRSVFFPPSVPTSTSLAIPRPSSTVDCTLCRANSKRRQNGLGYPVYNSTANRPM